MNTLTRKEIADALIGAIDREALPNREGAKFLNFHPCYISMAKNPNSWDSMGSKIWGRLEEWALTREKISAFKIPEGEPIYIPAERYSGERKVERQKSKQSKEKKEVVDISLKMDGSKLAGALKEKEAKAFAEGKKEVDKIVDNYTKIPNHPAPEFTDAVRLKVALDIEINLVVNGQKVQLR